MHLKDLQALPQPGGKVWGGGGGFCSICKFHDPFPERALTGTHAEHLVLANSPGGPEPLVSVPDRGPAGRHHKHT